jgi:parallel beta-helix repeat protein
VGNDPYYTDSGIILYNVQNSTITNNTVLSNWHGIDLWSSSFNNFLGNNVSFNDYNAFYLHSSSSYNTFSDNIIMFNFNIGIFLRDGSSHNNIGSNNIFNNTYGLFLLISTNNNITKNIISNNKRGIWAETSSDLNRINENYLSSNYDRGIRFRSASNNTLIGNDFINNKYSIEISISSDNRITGNNFTFNLLGIRLATTSRHSVTDNNLTDNYGGISLHATSNTNISGNYISNNLSYAIRLSTSSYNSITNNTITDNNDGIILEYSSNIVIANNTVSWQKNFGINFLWSSSNILTNNEMTDNGVYIYGDQLEHWNTHFIDTTNTVNGKPVHYWKNQTGGIVPPGAGQVILANSTNVVVEYQNVSNGAVGIQLGFSNNNTITNNTVSSNKVYGIFLGFSNSNKIFYNNILNNTDQAYDNTRDKYQWDNGYPLGGNYWSDYIGVDLNRTPKQDVPPSDGIGDTPYKIDPNSRDNYPLMKPYFYKPLENYTILSQGWNLISIPLIQENKSISKALEMINSYYDAVQWYDLTDQFDHWKHYKIGKPFGNDLFELNETMSFWIHITNPGETIFLYNGTQPISNQTIQLHTGWNMVGYPSLTQHNRTVGLNNLTFDTHVDRIQWYDAGTKTWHFMGPDDSFVPGRGYWVHSKVDAEWEVPL